jgi:hypothetical protein
LQFVSAAPFMAWVKPIRLSNHARHYTRSCGFTVAEVEETIRAAAWQPAELGRIECRKDFSLRQRMEWQSLLTKRVRPVFVEEAAEIVVVTVYTLLLLNRL